MYMITQKYQVKIVMHNVKYLIIIHHNYKTISETIISIYNILSIWCIYHISKQLHMHQFVPPYLSCPNVILATNTNTT